MKKFLAFVLTLCTLLTMSAIPAFASDTDAQSTVSDDYKWTFENTANLLQDHRTGPFRLVNYYTKGKGTDGAVWGVNTGSYQDMKKTDIPESEINDLHIEKYTSYTSGHNYMYVDLWNHGGTRHMMLFTMNQVGIDSGVMFTAPVTGTVMFKYRANEADSDAKLLIGRTKSLVDNSTGWNSDISGAEKVVDLGTDWVTDTVTLDVTEGEEIVFLIYNGGTDNYCQANFYFENVEYTSIKQAYKWMFENTANLLQEHRTGPFSLVNYYTKGKTAQGEADGNIWGITTGNYYDMVETDIPETEKSDLHIEKYKSYTSSHNHMYVDLWNDNGTRHMMLFTLEQVGIDSGVMFTAPVTGTVTFSYRAKEADSDAKLLIGRTKSLVDNSNGWNSDISGAEKVVDLGTDWVTDTVTLDVTAREEIVFLIYNGGTDNYCQANFYFESVEYTSIPTTEGVHVIGAQDKNDGTKYNTRFIATVDDYTQYEELGFRIEADYGNGNKKTYDRHCTEVFDSLIEFKDGVSVTKTALDFNGKYLFALTINNIPMEESGNATFSVKAYYVKDGQTTYTDAATFTTQNGELQ